MKKPRPQHPLHQFQVGDIVQANLDSPWKGVVQDVERRTEKGESISDLVTVLMTHYGNGKPARRHMMRTYEEQWFELVLRPAEQANPDPLKDALYKWRLDHDPRAFGILYDNLWPVVARFLQRYPANIQDMIRGLAWGHFIEGFYRWNPGHPMKTWFMTWMQRLSRDVHHLLKPGIPEVLFHQPEKQFKHP